LEKVLSKLVATKFWSNFGVSWRRLWLNKCLEQILVVSWKLWQILVSVEDCDKFLEQFLDSIKDCDKFLGAILCQLKIVIKNFRANLWYLVEKDCDQFWSKFLVSVEEDCD
jgi:hypothetical protein